MNSWNDAGRLTATNNVVSERKRRRKLNERLYALRSLVPYIAKYQVKLVHEIEAVIGKQLEEYNCNEDEVLIGITMVYKAKRLAKMRMVDDGFEEKAKEKKEIKLKMLVERGLLSKDHKKKRKRKNMENKSE